MKSSFLVLFSAILAKKISPDYGCVAFKCGRVAAACKFSRSCNTILDCINACPDADDNYTNLICNVDCMTVEDAGAIKHLTSLNECLVKKQCLPLAKKTDMQAPKINLFPLELNTLSGVYWIEWGLNLGYDCYSCQTMTFGPGDRANVLQYDYKFKSPSGVDGFIPAIIEPTSTDGKFLVKYTAMGVSGTDDWFVVGAYGTRVLLWYYGFSSVNGNYVGSVLIAKDKSAPISSEETEYFEALIRSLGQQKQDYSVLDNSKCGK